MTDPRTNEHPRLLYWQTIAAAKLLMKDGLDLPQAAAALGVRTRDLDYSLWKALGEPR